LLLRLPSRIYERPTEGEGMKVTKRSDQFRRDLLIDLECESCGATEHKIRAYDDTNFWVKVVPSFKCNDCNQSSRDLGIEPEWTSTKYPEGFQI